MTTNEENRSSAQVHWLIAGAFGLGQAGKTLNLARADFNEVLEKANITINAEVRDSIGNADSRTISLQVSSLKHLTLKHVIASSSELQELLDKASKAAKLKDPTVADIRSLLGEGKLADQLAKLIEPEPQTKATEDAPVETTGDVDTMLAKANVQTKSAKSAIDMFVRNATSGSKKKSRPLGRELRDAIESAVYGLASDVLRSEASQATESAWRGLRFLIQQCPKDAGMRVQLLETNGGDVLELLQNREREDGIEEPDAIFIPSDVDDIEVLKGLADFAEQEVMPVAIGVSPSLFGQEHVQDLPGAFDAIAKAAKEDVPDWAGRWDEFRLHESSRWLCAVANRVALYSEGAGAAKRTVFGSGVWGLASMLASSYARRGSFAGIYGKTGALSAPATHTIDRGAYRDTAAPTEAFIAINPSETLALNGILCLGSGRNSDQLFLIKSPMARGAKDAVPLPAQILTGRVVRFAYWVNPQLPEGCGSKEANGIFMAASSVFLFPGQDEAAHVRAAVTNIEGEAHVVVRAAANPAIAGIPFEIAFPIRLNWSVPAPEEVAEEEDGEAGAPKAADAGSAVEMKGDIPADKPEGSGGISSASVGFGVELTDKDK